MKQRNLQSFNFTLMEFVRGHTIGRGSFGTVNLALPKTNFPQISTPIVVKSAQILNSDSLKIEKEVFSKLGNNHPHIIQFLGDSFSFENGTQFYNLFLEFAGKGSLSDHLRISGGKFEYSDVKRFTKSILKGLCYIHEKGFVHCDIKLQNILLFENGVSKIADFGLVKRISEKTEGRLRGTPLYMSPEVISGADVEPPADVWALGCAVIEMVTGKPAWDCSPDCDVSALIYRIGVSSECPEIPGSLCPEGKDFLGKCLVKDPSERWTAQMLLDHPFISGFENDQEPPSVSPRCPFEFPDWESTDLSSFDLVRSCNAVGFDEEYGVSCLSFVSDRFERQLVSDQVPVWSDMDGWVKVR